MKSPNLTRLGFESRTEYDLKLSLGNPKVLGFAIRAKLIDSPGIVHDRDLADERWVKLRRNIPMTYLKLREAIYFFEQFATSLHNECAAYFNLSAFLSSLRAITFVLQKECSGKPGFQEWYGKKQQSMRRDVTLRKFVELRNESQKEGLEPPR